MARLKGGKKQWLHAALGALVAFVAFSMAATPIRSDNDVWWHLKTGQLIVETGLPDIDPLNHLSEAAGTVWHNHEWLGQWIFWRVYQLGDAVGLGGLRGVILGKAALVSLTYLLLALFAARMCGAFLPGAIAAAVACEIGRFTIHVRPPIYTYLLLVGLYGGLHWARVGGWKRRWALPIASFPLFALWANLHGGWAAGLVVMASFAGGAILEEAARLYRRAPLTEYFARVVRCALPWWLALAAAGLGTLCTPAGAHLYDMFGKVMGDSFLMERIGELQPPPMNARNFFFWVVLLGALPMLSLAAPRRFPFVAEYLFVPFFAWQSLQHWRHLTLFGLLAAPMLAWLLAEGFRSLPKGIAGLARAAALALFLALCGWWIAIRSDGGSYLQRNAQLLRGEAYYRENYPSDAVDFLLEARLPGKLFNLDYYAGYLIWRLSPLPYPVYSDMRFDVFGSQFARQAEEVVMGAPGWEVKLLQQGVNVALVPTSNLIAYRLAADPDWACVYVWGRPGAGLIRFRATHDAELGRLLLEKLEDEEVAANEIAGPASGWAIFVRRSAVSPAELDAANRLFLAKYAQAGRMAGALGRR